MPISNVYNQDCMIGMKETPDKYYQLAVVDPPYGINAPNMQMGSNPTRKRFDNSFNPQQESVAVKLRKGRLNQGGGHMKNSALVNMNCSWDIEKPSPEYFEQLKRISVNQIIWGGNYYDLPPTRCVVCWDKMQPWENFSQWEMAWTSFDKPAALFKFSNTGGFTDRGKIHPTQKPVELYSWLLTRFTQPGDHILDTHMSSQSSRIACYKLGFDYTGYEIDEQYFKDGNARFEKAIAEPLFDIPKPTQGELL